eukprot:TRINITY_DN42284_c0_g1_i1.p1 TRINITY_DN42284_c0_g1~~TRINITY_DN42284_c0_g1_i1.p1  ORF type:complete len:408 (-),score=45.16 TRINITY_DN42284_c0_g1_i1:59-1201(-)
MTITNDKLPSFEAAHCVPWCAEKLPVLGFLTRNAKEVGNFISPHARFFFNLWSRIVSRPTHHRQAAQHEVNSTMSDPMVSNMSGPGQKNNSFAGAVAETGAEPSAYQRGLDQLVFCIQWPFVKVWQGSRWIAIKSWPVIRWPFVTLWYYVQWPFSKMWQGARWLFGTFWPHPAQPSSTGVQTSTSAAQHSTTAALTITHQAHQQTTTAKPGTSQRSTANRSRPALMHEQHEHLKEHEQLQAHHDPTPQPQIQWITDGSSNAKWRVKFEPRALSSTHNTDDEQTWASKVLHAPQWLWHRFRSSCVAIWQGVLWLFSSLWHGTQSCFMSVWEGTQWFFATPFSLDGYGDCQGLPPLYQDYPMTLSFDDASAKTIGRKSGKLR